jgi:membrane fusion protein, multidrug efflux system
MMVCVHNNRTHIISIALGNPFEDALVNFSYSSARAHMTKSRTSRWILPILVLAALGYFGWQRFHGPDATAKTESAPSSSARTAVRVTIAPVEKADFPVYLTGLGTVQGFNTVVVRTRVDGQIEKIAFKEGQLVNQGDLLAQIDPRPYQAVLDQAKAKKAQDEANLANANLDLQRFTRLGEFATRQQTDTQRSTVAQLTAQIAADDAAIFNAQTQVDYTSVKAPISGVAGLRQVDVGNIVNASTQTGIVTIAQIEPIAVIFTAPEERLPYINEAQSREPLKVIALTTDGKKALSEGSLAVVNNQVDTTSGTIRLKAVFDNKDHALWPGQSVSTRLLVNTLKDATVVPDDAIQHSSDGLYAYVVNQDNKAELRKVRVSQSIDGRSVVDDGLSPGQQVITSGQFKVQPGTLVTTAVASSDPAQPRVKQE